MAIPYLVLILRQVTSTLLTERGRVYVMSKYVQFIHIEKKLK